MKNHVVANLRAVVIAAMTFAALAAAVPSAQADNLFGSFFGSLVGGVGGGKTQSANGAPNKNDSVEGMQERRYSYLETAEGAGARASTQPSFGYGGSDVRDDKGTAQAGMIMGSKLNGTLYSEVPLTPLATINFPVATKAQENEMYKHCPPLTGYHLTDSADYINTAIANDVLLGKLSDPERWVNVAKVTQQAQNTQTGNMMAEMARNQANSAIDFCSTYMTNFTTSKRWNDVRDKLFIPIAILLLLPGAMLSQVKAIVAAGNPVLEETHPFDGLLRSIIAIFLIPATCLVLNYGIDLSNSLTYTIKTEYQNIFHDDMYQSAICAEVRAFPVRQEAENRGALDMPTTKMGQLLPEQKTVFARVEGQLFSTKLEDPCAGLYVAPKERADEALPTKVVAARLAFNSMNAVLCCGWNALCAFQTVYLYYLWLMGPIVAALWVWPMKFLRDALPSWIEGCVTLCFWSLLWNTTILLMACFRGYDETGTFVMTALNTLATICVKYSFDFVQMVMAAGSQANAVGEKLGEAMKANTGGGHGAASRSGSGGGSHHTHGAAGGHGPTSRPSGALNSSHVLGSVAGGAGSGVGHGGGAGGAGGLAGALGSGHSGGAGGAGVNGGGGDLSAPLSLMAGHAGGLAGGVGGGLGAISHGGIPGSHGGTLPFLGNVSHGVAGIGGVHGGMGGVGAAGGIGGVGGAEGLAGLAAAAGGAGGHGLQPSAQFDVLNSNTQNMSHLSSMLGGDVTNLAGGGGGGLGSVFNGGDVMNMASTIGAASMFNSMSSSVTNGGDEVGGVNNLASLFEGADIDSTLNTAISAAGDISNISSPLNIGGGLTLNGGDVNLPPLSGVDVDNTIANMLGDDVANVANVANSVMNGADISNVSSTMNAAISGDVTVGGSVHSTVGGMVQNSLASVVNGGDVSSSNSSSVTNSNSIAASMINNLDVNNSSTAGGGNLSSVVDQAVDISNTMASQMDLTNVSSTSSSMSTDVSSSMVNSVDVSNAGPTSLSSSSTTYDVDNNAAHNVDVNNNSQAQTYQAGGTTQYTSGGDTQYSTSGGAQYATGGGTQYSSGGGSAGGGAVQYSESRSANVAASVGASMQNALANELGGGAPQGQASAMQQMYNMYGDTNVGGSSSSIAQTSAASFDSSSSYTTSSYSSSSTTYSDSGSVSAPPQVSYSGGDSSTSYAGGSISYAGGDSTSYPSSGGGSYSAATVSSDAGSNTYAASSSSSAGSNTYAASSSSTAGSNVVQALAPTQQGGTAQVAYSDSGSSNGGGSGNSPFSFNFSDTSSASNSAGSQPSGFNSSADATSIATPAASNYTYIADTNATAGVNSTTGGAAQTMYYVDNSSAAGTTSGGGAVAEYARFAMSDHSTLSHASAGAPPSAGGENIAPPSMIVAPSPSFSRQASLQDVVQQGLSTNSKQQNADAQPKPETSAKQQSKLGNALRGAGCPLPPSDKSAMPPSTKKPAQTNPQFAAGASDSAPPPVSRTDAMEIAAGNTRNRYRQTRKMTEEELRELQESASGWMV